MGELYTNKKAGWESGLGEEGEVYQVYGKAGIGFMGRQVSQVPFRSPWLRDDAR